jgi:hypothetical protein
MSKSKLKFDPLITKPRRVIIPLFELASNPTIPLSQIKSRRFNIFKACCICTKGMGYAGLIDVDIHLKELSTDSAKEEYTICKDCLRKTKKRIRTINKMNPRELPLYVSDPNVFVRNRAITILET